MPYTPYSTAYCAATVNDDKFARTRGGCGKKQHALRASAGASTVASVHNPSQVVGNTKARILRVLSDVAKSMHRSNVSGGCSLLAAPPSEELMDVPLLARCPYLDLAPEHLLDLSRVGVSSISECDALLHTIDAVLTSDVSSIGSLHGITGISLSHNHLGDNGVIRILTHLLPTPTSAHVPPPVSILTAPPKVPLLPALNCLDLFGAGLTDACIPFLIDCIWAAANTTDPSRRVVITKLKIGDNCITGHGLSMIAAALFDKLATLTQLHIGGNPLNEAGLNALAHAWEHAPHRLVNIGLRDLDKAVVVMGAKGMSGPECRATLDRGIAVLLGALGRPRRCVMPDDEAPSMLQELQLRGTPIRRSALSAFSRGFLHGDAVTPSGPPLPPLAQLQALDLGNCQLEDAATAIMIHRILKAVDDEGTVLTLRELHLNNNAVGHVTCCLLGQLLGGGKDVRCPEQKLSATASVARAITTNRSVEVAAPGDGNNMPIVRCPLATLNLADNHLPSHSITNLLSRWVGGTGSSCLNALTLSNNTVHVDAMFKLRELLALQCSAPRNGATGHGGRRVLLSTLIVHNCDIDTAAAVVLFDALAQFPGRIRVLEMPQNRCGNGAVPALCNMLRCNQMVAKLFLQDNAIQCSARVCHVEAALATNPTVRCISLGGQSAAANALTSDQRHRMNLICERNKAAWLHHRQVLVAVVPIPSATTTTGRSTPSEAGRLREASPSPVSSTDTLPHPVCTTDGVIAAAAVDCRRTTILCSTPSQQGTPASSSSGAFGDTQHQLPTTDDPSFSSVWELPALFFAPLPMHSASQ